MRFACTGVDDPLFFLVALVVALFRGEDWVEDWVEEGVDDCFEDWVEDGVEDCVEAWVEDGVDDCVGDCADAGVEDCPCAAGASAEIPAHKIPRPKARAFRTKLH